MEGKDNSIFYVKQAVRGVDELKVAPEDWPKERERMIRDLHDEVDDTNFRHTIEDLRLDAWNNSGSRMAKVVAKAAKIYNIPFGKAGKRRLAGK